MIARRPVTDLRPRRHDVCARQSVPGPKRNADGHTSFDGALGAARRAGVAHPPAVEDEHVGHLQPALARVELHQHPLDLVRVGVPGEAEPRESRRTCVSTAIPSRRPKAFDATTAAVLRPTPGSVHELGRRRRHLAPVPLEDRDAAARGSPPSSGGRSPVGLISCSRSPRRHGQVVLGRAEAAKERRRHLVHAARRSTGPRGSSPPAARAASTSSRAIAASGCSAARRSRISTARRRRSSLTPPTPGSARRTAGRAPGTRGSAARAGGEAAGPDRVDRRAQLGLEAGCVGRREAAHGDRLGVLEEGVGDLGRRRPRAQGGERIGRHLLGVGSCPSHPGRRARPGGWS